MRFSHASGALCKFERSTVSTVCGRLATGSRYARPPLRGGSPRTESLAAAIGIQPVSFPRSGCGLRRDGRDSFSVSPETRRRPTHSRSRSQAAIADFHSSARRRNSSRHAGGIPKGKALWSLLPTSGESEVGPRREYKATRQTRILCFLRVSPSPRKLSMSDMA